MALNTFGLECLQGMLQGFGSIVVVTVLVLGIRRLVVNSISTDGDYE